jgi:hypothetical protein
LRLGASTIHTPRETSPQGPVVSLDDQLVTVAQLVPGFGGVFFDDNGDLTVYMVTSDAERHA